MEYLPHQQRVIDEKIALDIKLDALNKFTGTDFFGNLPDAERWRLYRQLTSMNEYSDVLAERIAAFD